MRETDVTVQGAETTFRDVAFVQPMAINGRCITHVTLAIVEVTVVNRTGARAYGRGASMLSVPWAWPSSTLSVHERDRALRDVTEGIGLAAVGTPAADPIRHWHCGYAALDEVAAKVERTGSERVPHLAATLCLAAVDSAVHDGWSRAAGKPAYSMYTAEHLTDDLASLLGADFTRRYPGDFFASPRRTLPIQHVVGASDVLERSGTPDGARALDDWLRTDQPRHFKIKLSGRHLESQADRVAAVHDLARRSLPPRSRLTLAIDPNEAYESPLAVVELLSMIRDRSAAAAQTISYVEQPIPRDEAVSPDELKAVTEQVPVLIDEGHSSLTTLRGLVDSGWAGAAIKASKGQTMALLVHAYARAHGLYLTLQDLTSVDLALHHSARLASMLTLSAPHFEYNSRQYADRANEQLRREQPDLVVVDDGNITIAPPAGPGLY